MLMTSENHSYDEESVQNSNPGFSSLFSSSKKNNCKIYWDLLHQQLNIHDRLLHDQSSYFARVDKSIAVYNIHHNIPINVGKRASTLSYVLTTIDS